MVKKLLNFIKEQKLFQPDEKILLAVSGGIDSMVMADLFTRAKINFAIAHCNFQLRGSESDDDQKLVEQVAINSILPFYWKSFETERFAKKEGISIQMAARDLRSEWFRDLMDEEGYNYVATAHHLNDSIETTIFNLAKGTGISGLKGIVPKSGRYIRPLMFATREMITNYANEENISWRVDKSNSSTKYHRNQIRHKIIPELRKINPNLEETFSYSMEKIAYSELVFKQEMNKHKVKLLEKTKDGFKIEIEKAAVIPESKIVLFELLEEFGFNYHQTGDIVAALKGQPGKYFYSENYQLLIDREYLFLSEKQNHELTEVLIDEKTKSARLLNTGFSFGKIERQYVKVSEDRNTAFVDYNHLRFPLKLRPWKHGDRFQPLGMKHKKKLSDFMIDNKIPLNLKKQVKVLLSGKTIVWVVGYRIDERFKITDQTKKIYKISLNYD